MMYDDRRRPATNMMKKTRGHDAHKKLKTSQSGIEPKKAKKVK
jgi:hypothetical protein